MIEKLFFRVIILLYIKGNYAVILPISSPHFSSISFIGCGSHINIVAGDIQSINNLCCCITGAQKFFAILFYLYAHIIVRKSVYWRQRPLHWFPRPYLCLIISLGDGNPWLLCKCSPDPTKWVRALPNFPQETGASETRTQWQKWYVF